MFEKPTSVEELTTPDEFYKIINDFINDILITFPEYSGIISRWWNRPNENIEYEQLKKKKRYLFLDIVLRFFLNDFLIFYIKMLRFFLKNLT
jgi:hypothetical protein